MTERISSLVSAPTRFLLDDRAPRAPALPTFSPTATPETRATSEGAYIRPPPWPSPAAASDESTIRDINRVYIHACGRLETVHVERVSYAEVRSTAQQSFDFPQDEELVLMDKDGEELVTDAAVQNVVAQGETICVRLSEDAMHMFERRIDQLQHMQISYLSDQLAAFRQDHAELKSELKGVRHNADQEHGMRLAAIESLRQEIEEVKIVSQRSTRDGESKFDAFEAAVFDLTQIVREETTAREHTSQLAQRGVQEVKDLVATESKAREHGDEKMRHVIEEIRRAVKIEVTDREDSEVRVERSLLELRRAIEEVSDAHKAMDAEMRILLLDLKQECAIEQRERITADTDLANLIKEVRGVLQVEARQHSGELSVASARYADLETSLEAERLARQQALAELTQQLGVTVESLQEEQTIRASEDAELSRTADSFRKTLEDVRRRQGEAELAATKLAHDLAKRVEEEARVRDMDVAKLSRLVNEEVSERHDAIGNVSRAVSALQESVSVDGERRIREAREMAQRIDSCWASAKAEQKERVVMIEELREHLHEHRASSRAEHERHDQSCEQIRMLVADERQDRDARFEETSQAFRDDLEAIDAQRRQIAESQAQLREMLEEEQKERAALVAELGASLKELYDKQELEGQAREQGQSAISCTVNAISEALEQLMGKHEHLHQTLQDHQAGVADLHEQLHGSGESIEGHPVHVFAGRIRNDCFEAIDGDLSNIREGMTKVVEAVQQERRSRSEANTKLREDCREAIQKEINARLERDSKFRDEIESEGRARMEAVEVIELAIQECLRGLETHTHDLALDETDFEDVRSTRSSKLTSEDGQSFKEESTRRRRVVF
eukprot:TRINITY_DN50678_c0_g1_i1.p1 TRINITY_DN50678_c0_g1~~TRINITY_DN50678_c0_g1_i1.p1  ORF type:complete len:848 (+),score=187.42 TRINITY_DN50678_c0_g1_i1:301-2844(+)